MKALLLSLLLATFGSPQCWEKYQSCFRPCINGLEGCNLLAEWQQMSVCFTGPDADNRASQWCRIDETPTTVASSWVATCVGEMPDWCRGHDKDGDGDVDLRDIAERWRETP